MVVFVETYLGIKLTGENALEKIQKLDKRRQVEKSSAEQIEKTRMVLKTLRTEGKRKKPNVFKCQRKET